MQSQEGNMTTYELMLSMINVGVFYFLQSFLRVFSVCYCFPPVAATQLFPKHQVDNRQQSKYDNKLRRKRDRSFLETQTT